MPELNRRTLLAAGAGLAVGAFTGAPALARSYPSMRMIVDMADFDASRSVIPGGQSRHPTPPHYD